MKDHVLIIHYNNLDKMLQIVADLKQDPITKSKKILLMDERLQQNPEELAKKEVKFIKGEPSQIEFLKNAGVVHASHVLILANVERVYSDLEALAIVLKLKELNPEIKIVAECLDPKNISLLKKAGCQSVVCIGTVLGQMIAQEIQDPGVHEVINQLTCNSNAGQFFIVDLPKTCHSVADVQAYSVKTTLCFYCTTSC